MNAITGSTALWYASRATGVVSLLLLTAVVLLGMLVNRQGRLPGLPRFVVTGLHRNLSLLSVVFVAIHVVTAVADPYVTIRLVAIVIPFASAYKPLLARPGRDLARPDGRADPDQPGPGPDQPPRSGGASTGSAYAAWPVAVVHSMGSSTDLQRGLLLYLTIACVLAVVAAAGLAGVARRPGGTAGRARRRRPGRASHAPAWRPAPAPAMPENVR